MCNYAKSEVNFKPANGKMHQRQIIVWTARLLDWLLDDSDANRQNVVVLFQHAGECQ